MNGCSIATQSSIASIVKTATRLLNDCKIADARLNAEILLSYFLKCRRVDLYKNGHRTLDADEIASFQRLIKKNSQGYPLVYLTGKVDFMSLEFKVVPGVLIPRPETELVVEEGLRLIQVYNDTETIAEIGTGCGNIIVSLAKLTRSQNIRFWASDISYEALNIARENSVIHKVEHKINFCHGDLFGAFDVYKLKEEIDFLVSNPPYVSQKDYDSLPSGIKDHEPRQALLAGETGLELHRRIIEGAVRYLKPGGYLVLEIGYNQSGEVREILAGNGCFDSIFLVKDLQGINRVISARRKTEK